MKVVILCGGYGTRIRDVETDMPKPMIKIGNMPILLHIMKSYSKYGFNDFILCTGYKSDLIKNFFLNLTNQISDISINFKNNSISSFAKKKYFSNWNVDIIDTGLDSLTGTRIKKIKKFIKEDNFFLTYGDGVSNINIGELLKFHLNNKKMVTVTGVKPPGRFGELKLSKNKVVSFNEKTNNQSNYINGGFFVCSKKVFDSMSEKNHSFEFDTLIKVVKKKQLVAFKHNGFWHPMDTSRDYLFLNELSKKRIPPWEK